MKQYKATALFEVDFNTCGSNYLVIYGKHINGYYCCIPNWKIGCEMADPNDTFYNYERLKAAGIDKQSAKDIAQMIKKVAETYSDAIKSNQQNLKAKYRLTDEDLSELRELVSEWDAPKGMAGIALLDLVCNGDI